MRHRAGVLFHSVEPGATGSGLAIEAWVADRSRVESRIKVSHSSHISAPLTNVTPSPGHPRRWQRWLFWGLILATGLVLLSGRSAVGWWARRQASQSLAQGDLSGSQLWLARAERLRPDHLETHLLRARLHRHRGNYEAWNETLEGIGSSAASAVQLEQKLGDLRWGRAREMRETTLAALTQAGADVDDAATAIVFAALAAGDEASVRRTLARWEAQEHGPVQLAYMRGVYWQSQSDAERAEQAFHKVLERQPQHELARFGLAQTHELNDELEPALEQFAELLRRSPNHDPARIGLSRVLRRLGRGEEAGRLWEHVEASEAVPLDVMVEIAEVHYQLGNYERAVDWYEQAELAERPHYTDTLRVAASAYALAGRASASRSLIDGIDANQERSRRLQTLESRVATDQSDVKAAVELRQLAAAPVYLRLDPELPTDDGLALFARHCAACHGERGEGNGRAAANLYPRPRNLRRDRFRLVSTAGSLPTKRDIGAVLRNGIPGTAMPGFAQLNEKQLQLLVDVTYQMRRDGIRELVVEGLQEAGEEPVPERVERIVQQRITPAVSLGPPASVPATQANIAAGKELYGRMACDSCHGPDGRGAEGVAFFGEDGLPTIPRDLVSAPFKGGDDPVSLFRRLRLGMPGTAHPANPTATDEELGQLVAYCLSLSAHPKPLPAGGPTDSFPAERETNLERMRRANRRALDALQNGARSAATGNASQQ